MIRRSHWARRARRAFGAGILLVSLVAASGRLRAAGPGANVDDLIRAVVEDSNYKIRVQAALVLGKLGDRRAVPALIKALADPNKTVRGISAGALGQLGDPTAGDALRGLLKREPDDFVRGQAERALASLTTSAPKRAKIYLAFGPFTGGVKSAGADAARILHEALSRDLGKLPTVTLSISAGDQANFAKSGMLGFWIDGNITRLDDVAGAGGTETSCDVKVMVARWPNKSLIMWTNAGASLQSGPRPRDKEIARKDCLEASAGQLSEDLGRFFKAQGG